MAFLDNSGDIILDAVLTDAGRQRMARGEFKIVKFAFGDEEINYKLFNSTHPSGSAFSDLQIMQTPILEAFTNNTSLMKTKLISINRNNLLYMPIFRVNQKLAGSTNYATNGDGHFVILADENTANNGTDGVTSLTSGVHYGTIGGVFDEAKRFIAIDQGLETAGNPPRTSDMPDDLIETAFLIRMDHRLLRLYGFDKESNPDNGTYAQKANSFVDDDAIATYYISSTDASVVGPREGTVRFSLSQNPSASDLQAIEAAETFNGPLGPRLRISPKTSVQVQQSSALFDELGQVATEGFAGGIRGTALASGTYKFIDTIINVVGVTTGYSIDIPIRIIKKN
tara:strand:+ start:2738 stop:3757 length:1020 start_codon:yes stop_codon:yes gene_type:complete